MSVAEAEDLCAHLPQDLTSHRLHWSVGRSYYECKCGRRVLRDDVEKMAQGRPDSLDERTGLWYFHVASMMLNDGGENDHVVPPKGTLARIYCGLPA